MTREEAVGIGQSVLATLCFSTGAVLVRWAGALPPVEITSLRLLVGAGLVAVAARYSRQPGSVDLRALVRLLPIGVVCALHFLSFIAALRFTSVAHALTLTYTAPLMIAGLSRIALGEPLPRRTLPGAGITLAGVAVLAGFEPHFTGRMLVGDALALAAAVTFALYSILGRRERDTLPLLRYAAGVYLWAGLVTLPFALTLRAPTHPWPALTAVAAMALIPSALGHTLYNGALRRLHPSLPNLIATQEVTLGILLAWLLLGEAPGWNALAGAALTLLGIALVLR
jgi:drug/metabolite transporter (DMT)-like permease